MKYPFTRLLSDDLILVSVIIDGRYKLRVAVDTAASHTVLDSNALYIVGYDFSKSIVLVLNLLKQQMVLFQQIFSNLTH